MTLLLLLTGGVLAAVEPEDVKPGWLALVVLALVGLATFLLWRSMNRQLRKVDFDESVEREDENRDS